PAGEGKTAPPGKTEDRGGGGRKSHRRPGGDSRLRHHHHGYRPRPARVPEPYDYYECGKHCGGTGGHCGGSDSDRRHVAQEFVFAGGTDRGRNLATTKCRSSVPRGRWVRCPLWIKYSQSSGGE